MANQRDRIKFTEDELADFLATERVINIATFNHDQTIHLVAMWFALVDGVPWFHTYPKSQKVLNLRRDPRMTGLVEAGDVYEELRGVELVGRGIVVDDKAEIERFGTIEARKYFTDDEDTAKMIGAGVAEKRVAVRFEIDRVVSWDHRKL